MDRVVDYLSRVAGYPWWQVAIELFSIGLVVYWAVDFLEGTRGERLFRGVIFILAAGVIILEIVADRFGFVRLQYLYKGFLVAVLVIAVAAFQPEIRRILIRIGQPRFWTGSSQRLARTTEEIISAVMDLSSLKTGALIVLEKKVALGEFIETGIRLDASVTTELLKTIFYPGSPLHDMAVIIRGDLIIAALVQLPLAEPGTVGGVELGSRHRAAIGMASGSDALIIVVSEETGIVSIAEGGQLTRNITEADLRNRLTTTMREMVPVTDRLRRLHRKDNLSDYA